MFQSFLDLLSPENQEEVRDRYSCLHDVILTPWTGTEENSTVPSFYSAVILQGLSKKPILSIGELKNHLKDEERSALDGFMKDLRMEGSTNLEDFVLPYSNNIVAFATMGKRLHTVFPAPILWTSLVNLSLEQEEISSPIQDPNIKDLDFPFQTNQHFDVKTCFTRTLEKLEKDFNNRLYCPNLPVCQSSGVGKTKLLLEMSKDYFLLYFNCRSPDQQTIPLRTAKFIDMFEAITTVSDWISLLLAMILALFNRYKMSPGKFLRDFHVRNNFVRSFSLDIPTQLKFYEEVLKMHVVIKDQITRTSDESALEADILKVYRVFVSSNDPDQFKSNLRNSVVPTEESTPTAATEESKPSRIFPKNILLCFDEASMLFLSSESEKTEMNTCFSSFRRALRIFPQDYIPILCVVLDTNSKVGNFAPEAKYESSARAKATSTKLPVPYYLFPLQINFPATSRRALLKRSVEQTRVVFLENRSIFSHCIFHPYELARQSRPMFATMALRPIKTTAYLWDQQFARTLLDFAISKLLNGKQEKLFIGEISEETRQVLFYVLAATRYHLTSTVPFLQDLVVKEHMAMLVGVTQERDRVVVIHPSEPILAAAAQSVSLCEPVFTEILRTIATFVSRRYIATSGVKGEMGELISSIILSRSFDLCAKRIIEGMNVQDPGACLYSRRMPLKEMLQMLYPDRSYFKHILQEMVGCKYKQTFFSSIVYFNHFVKVEYHVEHRDLRNYLRRCAAIICKNGEAGIDIAIPLAIPKQEGNRIILQDESTYNVSAWIIQVKNWSNPINSSSLGDQIADSNLAKSIGFAVDQLYMIMNVGPGGSLVRDAGKSAIQTTSQEKEIAGVLEGKKIVTLQFCGVGDDPLYSIEFLSAEEKHILSTLIGHEQEFDIMKSSLMDLSFQETQISHMIQQMSPLTRK